MAVVETEAKDIAGKGHPHSPGILVKLFK